MNSENESLRLQLKQELYLHALKFGDFTLASGQKSNYYINCKPVTLSSRGSYLTGINLLKMLPEDCMAVGGLSLGADPIVSAIVTLSHLQKNPVQGYLVRKEKKGHGTESQVENLPQKGSKVVIVDDVITTGGSALKAAEISLELGLEVIMAMCIVDRKQGGEEAFSELNIPMKSIFSIEEFLHN